MTKPKELYQISKKLSDDFRSKNEETEWRDVAGLRFLLFLVSLVFFLFFVFSGLGIELVFCF